MLKNQKKLKNKLILVLTLLISVTGISVSAMQPGENSAAANEIPFRSYAYVTDIDLSEKVPVYSKPMYETALVINSNEIGNMPNSRINDVVTDDQGNVYLLDSGNSRICILNSEYQYVKSIGNLTFEGQSVTFVDARGIFVDQDGLIYIADTENARVLLITPDGIVEDVLLLPESNLIPSDFKYRPIKVAVDSKHYTYIACDGSYYGAILYSPEMEFLGFFGANTVKATTVDVLINLWDRLTSNDVKRAADELSLPYTFTDLVVDSNDFIYTVTGRSGTENIQHGQICILNPGGKDILDASDVNFADYAIGSLRRDPQIQDLSSIAVDNSGFFYALDTTYGRVFCYDEECSLLSVFGGSFGDGNQKGTFRLPSGIAVNGTDVLVSDSQKNSLTVFKATEYGILVREAQAKTLSGDFASALTAWEEVINKDANCQLAYRGIAKAYYDMAEYEKAMKYAELGADRLTYSDAFKAVRTEMLEDAFGWVFIGAVLLIAGITAICVYKKKHNIVLIKNERFKVAMSSVTHPVDSFRLVKEKQQGSIIISTVVLILFYIITVLNDTAGGFAFTVFDVNNYNSVYILFSTIGLIILWTCCNWLVCTLAGGIGKIKEIYIITCYSLIPIVFARACRLLLTHVLVPEEGAFLEVFVVVCTLYAAFMLIIGIMRIHDYEFGKFVGTSVFTIIAMLIVVFLIFLIFLLSQQLFGWIQTLYIESVYR